MKNSNEELYAKIKNKMDDAFKIEGLTIHTDIESYSDMTKLIREIEIKKK